jgi:hypothetical protein
MSWLYTILMGFVFFAAVAMLIREGLWSNLLTLFNVLFSGLLAFSLHGPVTTWLDESLKGEYTYLLDFLVLWAIFSLSMLVLRILTDTLSRVRVRFKKPVESAGGPIAAVIAAWVVLGFTSATFNTVPLAKGFLGNAIVVENEQEVEPSLTRPHLQWLRFVGSSIMKLGDADTVDELKDQLDGISKQKEYTEFCRGCDFINADLWARVFVVKYQLRREQFETNTSTLRVKRG